MAQIDKLKEEIGWLKVIFAILIATDISLVAWVIQKLRESQPKSFDSGCDCSNSGYTYNYLAQ